jgi:hypothetical protein
VIDGTKTCAFPFFLLSFSFVPWTVLSLALQPHCCIWPDSISSTLRQTLHPPVARCGCAQSFFSDCQKVLGKLDVHPPGIAIMSNQNNQPLYPELPPDYAAEDAPADIDTRTNATVEPTAHDSSMSVR